MSNRTGILFVISAPSGGGKSTLLRLLAEKPDFVYSVSCTTRKPRPGEEDGRDYHFLSVADFERKVKAGDFLEYAKVHGNYYGTLRQNVLDGLAAGQDILIDVDIQGAAQIRSNAEGECDAAMVDVFLMPPSMVELERRLRKRATETEEQLAVRLGNAAGEMAEWRNYRYVIVSGLAAADFERFRAIMVAERMRASRLDLNF